MKFSEILLAHMTTEWAPYYIQYESLKEFVKESKLNCHGQHELDEEKGEFPPSDGESQSCHQCLVALCHCLCPKLGDADVIAHHKLLNEPQLHSQLTETLLINAKEDTGALVFDGTDDVGIGLVSDLTVVSSGLQSTMSSSISSRESEKGPVISSAYASRTEDDFATSAAKRSKSLPFSEEKEDRRLLRQTTTTRMRFLSEGPQKYMSLLKELSHSFKGDPTYKETLKNWKDCVANECQKVDRFFGIVFKELEGECKDTISRMQRMHSKFAMELMQDTKESVSLRLLKSAESMTPPPTASVPLSSSEASDSGSLLRPKGARQRAAAIFDGQIFMTSEQREWHESIYNALVLDPLNTASTKKQSRKMALYQIKLHAYILYQRLIGLQNFAILNRIGFNKILKKFDKNLGSDLHSTLLKTCVDSHGFAQCALGRSHFRVSATTPLITETPSVPKLMQQLTVVHAHLFENGDTHAAKMTLVNSLSWSDWSSRDAFIVGGKGGLAVGLLVACVWDYAQHSGLEMHTVYIFRALGAVLLWNFLWAFNIFIWTLFRINYIFVFEFDPRTRRTFQQIFDDATNMALLYLGFALAYIRFSAAVLPSAMLVFFFVYVCYPLCAPMSMSLNMSESEFISRRTLGATMFQTVIAPIGRVKFRDVYCGDVLTSMSKVLADFQMAVCLVATGATTRDAGEGSCHTLKPFLAPICICAPYWFRFMQCLNRYAVTGDRFPHLPNAFKYALSMSVTIFGALHSTFGASNAGNWGWVRLIWILLTIFTTCYLYWWDIFKDWQLFGTHAPGAFGEQKIDPVFGRPLEYPIWWYYCALVADLVLRFFWTFTLMPEFMNPFWDKSQSDATNQIFLAFVECLELCRRCLWGVFRLEKAHVSRKDEFHSFEFIPLLFEHSKLREENKERNRPKSMWYEILGMVATVLLISAIIWITALL